MATVPISGTNIRLLSGVPFSNDYKHTRWFNSLSEQTNYFLGRTVIHSMTQANFQRIEGHTYVAVNRSIDDLWGVNYLMFQNASYNSKWFYAFVTQLEYVNKNTTYVHFEIDVLQTWRFDISFKPSFVVREHRPLWNSDGTPVINTVDEGLYYGSEYETVAVDHWVPYDDLFFLVIVSKTTIHNGSDKKITPVLNGLPQALSYYIHPFKLNNTVPSVHIGQSSFNLSPIIDVLKAIFTDTDAVNNVVSMYVTDFFGGNFVDVDYSDDVLSLSDTVFEGCQVSDGTNSFNTIHLKKLVSYSYMQKTLGDKYRGFKHVNESKLLMYPYAFTVLDDFKGNRQIIKNEYINGIDLSIRAMGSLGTSNKVAYMVDNYLQDADAPDVGVYKFILQLENALINNNPNDLPILSSYLSAFIQGNKNQIENQKQSIVFNGVVDGIGSAVAGGVSAMTGNFAGLAFAGANVVGSAGNTALRLQAIQAKMKDLANIPPQLVKMGGNSAFEFGNNFTGVYVIKKQITDEYIKKLEDYFKMFGYKTNEVKVPNLNTRRSWNYVQTADCQITGNLNREDLEKIKSVFDNGITLWHVDDVGNYSLDNGVI